MTFNPKEISIDRLLPWASYSALVIDNQDPEGQGRVKITLSWLPEAEAGQYEAWARLSTLMAGNSRGSWFIPEIGDEVVVTYLAGNPDRPVIIGSLWNGQDAPPETIDSDNNAKSIVSRQGISIRLDDSEGQETLSLKTPAGQSIVLRDGEAEIEISDSNGNRVRMDSSGIAIDAAANVTINGSTVKISAGMVTVDAGMSKFSGVVQTDTLIANSVVASSFTPGAGNIW
jgi:uncharacterized protein involved in type VI secretion and phage assembly